MQIYDLFLFYTTVGLSSVSAERTGFEMSYKQQIRQDVQLRMRSNLYIYSDERFIHVFLFLLVFILKQVDENTKLTLLHMKRILVPTDFSDQAENALKVAAQIANKYGSEIYLLHMLELPMHTVDAVSTSSTDVIPEAVFFMKAAHERFEDLISRDYLQGINVIETVNSNYNKAYEGIIAGSKENNVDMIIMGSDGSTGLEEFLVGSNTEKVVRNSNVPVLVIKHEHEVFRVDDFVYATAFEAEDLPALEKASEFAKTIKSKLHLLFVNTASQFKTTHEVEHMMENYLKKAKVENYTLNIYNDTSRENGILNFSRTIDAGLIGISTHGRKGLSHFLNGSLSEDLVNHAQRPVITFKI